MYILYLFCETNSGSVTSNQGLMSSTDTEPASPETDFIRIPCLVFHLLIKPVVATKDSSPRNLASDVAFSESFEGPLMDMLLLLACLKHWRRAALTSFWLVKRKRFQSVLKLEDSKLCLRLVCTVYPSVCTRQVFFVWRIIEA